MLQTENLRFAYPALEEGEQETLALGDVDVKIEKGSFVVVLGHNGSGKSTLAKTFNAVLLPSGGRVLVEGMDTREEALLLEIRRGKTYDAIIMDPPSYGRGPGGEVWKLEENLFPFVKLCAKVLSDKPLFVIINSYTTGLAPSVLGYMLHMLVAEKYGGKVTWDELGLPVTETGLALPCGATGRWFSE